MLRPGLLLGDWDSEELMQAIFDLEWLLRDPKATFWWLMEMDGEPGLGARYIPDSWYGSKGIKNP